MRSLAGMPDYLVTDYLKVFSNVDYKPKTHLKTLATNQTPGRQETISLFSKIKGCSISIFTRHFSEN